MKKLTIRNQTKWSTRDIRSVLLRVLNESIKHEGQHRYVINAKVVNTRRHGYSGYAYLNSGSMKLRVPSAAKQAVLDAKELGWLFDHELAHCRGLRHRQMGRLNRYHEEDYGYLDGFTVNARTTKPKAAIGLRQLRADRIAARIAAWQAKKRRAETALKKLLRKQAYYARQHNE